MKSATLRAVEGRSVENIFQKYGLKYVLGVTVILEMDHTDPADGIRIPVDCPAGFFLAAHNSFPVSISVYLRP